MNELRLCENAAEAAVLGSMMQDSRCIGSVCDRLTTDDFFIEAHQTLFDAIVALYRKQGALDGLLVRTSLTEAGQLEKIGGLDYLRSVIESTPSSVNVGYYSDIVADRSAYRKLVAAVEAMQAVLHEPLDADKQIQAVKEITVSLSSPEQQPSVHELSRVATQIALDMTEDAVAVPTGFADIDRFVGGFEPGELIVLAGRPAMGKTALALDIALRMSQTGKHIVFFTLEMTMRQLVERLICGVAGVDSRRIKRPDRSSEDVEKLYAGALELGTLRFIIGQAKMTAEQQISVLRDRKDVDVVFVDYLGLMSAGRRTGSRHEEVSEISRKLKEMALSQNVPVVAVSQLNRQADAREGHRPRLSDLRDSGSLEQDASIVMLIFRQDYYRRDIQPDTAEVDGSTDIIVAKNRRGPTGIAKLVFVEKYAKFADLAYEE